MSDDPNKVEVSGTVEVDTGTPPASLPHADMIKRVTWAVLVAFAAVSFYVLKWSEDAAQKGAIVQTWTNLAIAAVTLWVGTNINNMRRHP